MLVRVHISTNVENFYTGGCHRSWRKGRQKEEPLRCRGGNLIASVAACAVIVHTYTQTDRHTHMDTTTDRTANLIISSNVHFVSLAEIANMKNHKSQD